MDRPKSSSKSVPDWVGQQYYRVGLFCARHPRPVLFLAVLVVIYSCWPLLSIPVYIGRPSIFVEPVDTYVNSSTSENQSEIPSWLGHNRESGLVAYVQQIIVKAMVHPYKKDEMIKADAFRGPLASSFKLHLQDLALFRDPNTGQDMDHLCLRTDGLADKYKHNQIMAKMLPDYGCLMLSPANLWQRDPRSFQLDANVISTVFNFQGHQREGFSSFADLLFGLRQRDTGLTKYPVRNRQRVITYAITVALQKYDPDFIQSLKSHLFKLYPLFRELNGTTDPAGGDMIHLYFSSKQTYAQWIPFAITIFMLFFYVYFSCKRIEFVKSKLGIALSAIVTVICTTCMSLGLSGVSLNMNSKISLVPYLVAFISLENVLAITQSVISTPGHLDVKIRIAQGLSKEGWNITKNLLAELTILSFIFLLGIWDIGNSVQEFCHLAIMGLISDFFLQNTFFITILSLDVSQMELSDSVKKPKKVFRKPVSGPGLIKRLSNDTSSVVAPNCTVPEVPSKRLKLMNFLGKHRIIQRLFLLCMVGWITIFIYQSSLIEGLQHYQHELFLPNETRKSQSGATSKDSGPIMAALHDLRNLIKTESSHHDLDDKSKQKHNNILNKLLPPAQDYSWSKLPSTHWPMLFSLYNITLHGRYITLLPPIHLSMIIGPESAKMLRHPKEVIEAESRNLQHQDAEESESDLYDDEIISGSPELSPFAPTSPSELFLAFVLCFPSLLFILYLVVVLYRCVCSRNYAEWRSSWNYSPYDKPSNDLYTQIVQESVPIELKGHKHEVESLVSDGNLVVSLCLGGSLSTWDSYTGEMVTHIDRSSLFSNVNGEKSSPPSTVMMSKTNGGISPTTVDLSPWINTNFTSLPTSLSDKSSHAAASQSFNFSQFERLIHHKKDSKESKDDTPLCPAVWCVDCEDGLIILGCANGRIEIWDVLTGLNKCVHDDGKGIGITHLQLCGFRLVIARLSGHLECLELKTIQNSYHRTNSTPSPNSISGPTRRYHARTSSGVSLNSCENFFKYSSEDDLKLEWKNAIRAHPQPLTSLDCQGGRILTGSHDHTLRVFRMEDHMAVYTLHGHLGPVTSAFIDKEEPSNACSGSQDGMMCTWDLLTGACVYSIQAHDGALLNLAYSTNYIISMGSDERLCVWERLQGHLINSIYLSGGPYCSDLVMLTHNLLVTGRLNTLVVWDVRLPDPVKLVKIGHPEESSQGVRIMCHLDDAIVCSYGSTLRLVKFPNFSAKSD